MFGNLGGLGDIAGLMKKAGDMQKNMKKVKEELAQVEVTGKSAGGYVEVVASCDFIIKKIRINPECIDSEDSEMLEDLIITATNNALNAAKEKSQEKLSEVTGGMDLPGMF